jgi:hypothetical protein
MKTDNSPTEISQLLFCEQCHARAIDFLEAATSAVRMAGIEEHAVIQARVEGSLNSFLSLHETCRGCNQD